MRCNVWLTFRVPWPANGLLRSCLYLCRRRICIIIVIFFNPTEPGFRSDQRSRPFMLHQVSLTLKCFSEFVVKINCQVFNYMILTFFAKKKERVSRLCGNVVFYSRSCSLLAPTFLTIFQDIIFVQLYHLVLIAVYYCEHCKSRKMANILILDKLLVKNLVRWNLHFIY